MKRRKTSSRSNAPVTEDGGGRHRREDSSGRGAATAPPGRADRVHDDGGAGAGVLRGPRGERRGDAAAAAVDAAEGAVGDESLVDDGGLRLLPRPVGDAEDGLGGARLVLGHLDVRAQRVRDSGPAFHVEEARQHAEPVLHWESISISCHFPFSIPNFLI